jgi:FAD/FMN-containing dehydrogenase
VLQPAGIAASPEERLLTMSTLLQQSRVDDLRSSFSGEVLTDADAGYDEARRVYNAMIDRYPALVARCRAASDVVAATGFAHDLELPLAVRGGGHNGAGLGVVDTES